jgi:hypothetical protein
MKGEIAVGSAKDGDKMVLESSDGPFGGVSSVNSWWY